MSTSSTEVCVQTHFHVYMEMILEREAENSEDIFRNLSLDQDPGFTSSGDQAAFWFHRIWGVWENKLFFPLHSEEQARNAKLILKIKNKD